jgi:hypothetical protein
MEFDPARVESLVLDRALSAGNISPPGGRPTGHQNRWGVGELPIKPATQTTAIDQPSPRNYWLSTAELKNRGFATAFS